MESLYCKNFLFKFHWTTFAWCMFNTFLHISLIQTASIIGVVTKTIPCKNDRILLVVADLLLFQGTTTLFVCCIKLNKAKFSKKLVALDKKVQKSSWHNVRSRECTNYSLYVNRCVGYTFDLWTVIGLLIPSLLRYMIIV